MASINDIIARWDSYPNNTHNFIKNDIVRYKGNFWYSLKDHTKKANTTEPGTISGNSFWGGVISLPNLEKVPFFIWIPSYTSTVQHKPSITQIRFGNGYEQRISKTINPDLKTFQLTFDQRTEHEARAIVHFFKSRQGSKSFIYNPPGIYSDTFYRTRYVVREWETNFTFKENYSIKAKIEEVSA